MLRIALAGIVLAGIGSAVWADDFDDCNAKRGDAGLTACDRIITSGGSTREQRGAAHQCVRRRVV